MASHATSLSQNSPTLLFMAGFATENPDYLCQQLITCIGNKRSLLGVIGKGLESVKARLGREKLRLLDGFAGSGVVSRFFKQHASLLLANDLEPYAETIARCYLSNTSEVDHAALQATHQGLLRQLTPDALKPGIISRLYAPQNDEDIQAGERVFYTARNARYLDTARALLEQVDVRLKPLLLAPLIAKASVHVNTSGVFKGFYKCTKTGKGKFGGNGSNALSRIMADISLELPVFSRFECEWQAYRSDINSLVKSLPAVDVAYLDPPYNQHPYGSNYFMLNLLVDYREPQSLSRVSGIPADWRRSAYNSRASAHESMRQLVRDTNASHVLVSFNNEGFIRREDMEEMLAGLGRVQTLAVDYNTFRGSRNLGGRSLHVQEFLFVVEKK